MKIPELILDTDQMIQNILRFKKITKSILKDKKVNLFYAVKANNSKEVLEIIFDNGLGAEVLSLMEMDIIPDNILIQVNGHLKSDELLMKACKRDNCTINLESICELNEILKIKPNKIIDLGIRLKVNQEQRIGFLDSDIPELIRIVQSNPNMRLTNLHVHAGWNLIDNAAYESMLQKMLKVHNQLKSNGITICCWNLGGSFSEHISYPGQLRERLKIISHYIPEDVTTICFEPGRYLVGDAGKLIATVEEIRGKEVIINTSTYGYMLTAGTPRIEHVDAESLNTEILDFSTIEKGICVSGIWPSENDYMYLSTPQMPINVGDKIIFYNMGAYIDGTFSTLFHEKILSYEFYGNLAILSKNLSDSEKNILCKYYKKGTLNIPQNSKERVIVLSIIALQFKIGIQYSENDINKTLKKFHPDYCFVRRELIVNSFFERYYKGNGEMVYERKK